MFVGPDGGLVDWPVCGFLADIEDHDGTIVATSSDKSGASGVEINAHDTGVCRERVLGPCGVLNCEAADEA